MVDARCVRLVPGTYASLTLASSYKADRSPASHACWKYCRAAARLPLALSCWPNLIMATVDVMRLNVSPAGPSVVPPAGRPADPSGSVAVLASSADVSDVDDVDGANEAACAACADAADADAAADAAVRTCGGGAGGLRPWASRRAL